MGRTVLHEDERGYVVAEGNELTVGSKIDDPPKVRVCVRTRPNGGGGGVFSASHARQDGVCYGDQQDEMGYVRIEQAEDVRGHEGNRRSELNVFLASGAAGTDVERVFACTWDAFTRWGASVLDNLRGWLGLPTISAIVADKILSPDALVELDVQNSSNLGLVLYERPSLGADAIALASFDRTGVFRLTAAGMHRFGLR